MHMISHLYSYLSYFRDIFRQNFCQKGFFLGKSLLIQEKTFIRGSAALRERGIKYLHMEGREAYISILNYYIL